MAYKRSSIESSNQRRYKLQCWNLDAKALVVIDRGWVSSPWGRSGQLRNSWEPQQGLFLSQSKVSQHFHDGKGTLVPLGHMSALPTEVNNHLISYIQLC